MKKILGIGNALVDVIIPIKDASFLQRYSLMPGSMQLVDRSFSDTIMDDTELLEKTFISGGSAANAISGIARMGVETGFIGKTGDDHLGKLYHTDLMAEGVHSQLLEGEIPTGRCIALVTPDSERTFATWLGSAVTLTPEELTLDMFTGWDIVHVEGFLVQDHKLLRKIAQLTKEAGAKFSLDLASYNVVEDNLEFLHSIVTDYVDIVFANEDEARAATGKEPEEAVRLMGNLVETAIVKIGAQGSLVVSGDDFIRMPAIDAKRIDTTGAGDLYAAGFLYEMAAGSSLKKMAKTGTLLATRVISQYGARIPNEKWRSIRSEAEQ
ncbi:adenosine kinase [bacterium]|nr:adenosine kinase [bacterium]